MKILVLIYEFPPVGGGGGQVALDICRVLSKRQHRIRVQTAWVKGLPKAETEFGFKVFRSFSFRKRADRCTIPEMAAYLLTNVLPALRHVLKWQPNIIHAHFAVPTGVLALLIRLITGKPYVLTVHLGDVPGALPEQTDAVFSFIKPFTTWIWKKAAVVTVVSDYIKELALRSYDTPIVTIPNGIALDEYRQSDIVPNNPPRLIFVGRFNPQKNLFFLLDVLNRIRDISWRFDVLGDGPQMNPLRNKIVKSGLAERIRLHGWVSDRLVAAFMSKADILLMPSITEGMPVVGVKALCHGLAIVGTDVGGIREVVDHGRNGFLCALNDTAAFESHLRTLLASPGRLGDMKRNSRQKASSYDLEGIVDRYERIFRNVISDNCGGD